MAKKTAVLESQPPNVVTDDRAIATGVQPCGAWCFILGPATGAFCAKDKNHEDEHEVTISVFVEPISEFKVTWTLDKSV